MPAPAHRAASVRIARALPLALVFAAGCGSDEGSHARSGDDAGAGGGTGGASAGDGGSGGAATDGSAPAPAECSGMALPPRARGAASAPVPSSLAAYFPTADFRTATPAEAGMDAAKLDAAVAFATAHSHTQGLVVLRHGYVVAETYAAGFDASTRHESYSMAKSFTSALVGIAIDRKLLTGVDQKACAFYPEWGCSDASDPRTRITLEHTMNVETGLSWHEDWRSNATGVNDTLLASGGNFLDYVLAKPASDEPGTVQRYSTGDPALVSGVLEGATGKTAFDYGQEVLFGPIGIPGVAWNADSKGRTTTYAGLQATAREFAKFGYLYLNGGKWDGRQVVPASWVAFTTRAKDACHDQYRYLWHINPPIRLGEVDPGCADFPNCTPTELADLPPDAFFAEGVFGQFIFVIPSADLVVARVAQDDFGSEYWDEYARGFLDLLLDAVAP